MPSRIPRFDAALDAYYAKLQLDEKGGQERVCRISGKPFYVRPEDVEFYKSIRVPLPTVSPDERHRQKWAFCNVYNLFKIKSEFSGKTIVAMYPPNTPYKIYEHKTWFGDGWDPMDYGRAVDANASFFEKFRALTLDVPRYNVFIDPASVNTEYANVVLRVKNCYLVFDSVEAENCWNGAGYVHTTNSGQCHGLFESDTCYGMSDCKRMYRSFWCEQSRDCQNSYFLYDCRDCDSCFGSVNLRHKKYYFLNEPLSKEAYRARIKEINFGSRAVVERYKKQFEELKRSAIHRPDHNENTTNSTGDRLVNSTNCYASSFMENAQNVAYCMGGLNTRDSYHTFGGVNVERGYETLTSLNTYNSKFCYFDKEGHDLEYCWDSAGCENCFGCVALLKKKFCVFNKQYAEEDYWPLVDALKTAMLECGEYGEFYPPRLSPFPYNISLATSYIGYDDIEEAQKFGYPIEKIPEAVDSADDEIVRADDLPDDIRDVHNDILSKIILGQDGKKFRIIKTELDFYRTHSIPAPRENPITVIETMRKAYGSIRQEFYTRACPRCGKPFETVYPASDPRIVYCKACYLKTIG